MELLIYLLKVSACTVLFFAFYLLVLRHLTFFKINRFYLLITLLLSFIIPTLNFTIEREVEAAPIVYTPIQVADEALVNEAISAIGSIETTPIIEESFDYYALLPYLYFGIVFSLLIIATWRILQLLKHTKNGAERINGLRIVQKSAGFTNCSFFNYVFIDEKLNEAELQVLLKHEEVHAKQFHSIDKIIMMLIKAFLWFNPVVYLYDKALEQAHEYEADEATSHNFGTEQYASLLLRLAIAKSEMPLVHNFVKSPIKDRIKMLFNSKSKNMKKLIYLLAMPIGLGLLWGFTVKVVEVAKVADVIEIDMQSNVASRIKKSNNDPLWSKTIRGKVKSILQTEVGEILNFKYEKGIIRILNLSRGNVSVGDEVLITIGGTVNDIKLSDAKGNVIKQLDGPCYGMDLMKTLDGKVLFDFDNIPFLSKSAVMQYGQYKSERFTLHTVSGKIPSLKIVHSPISSEPSKVFIYVNGKLYSEKETLKFDKNFIANLSEKRGFAKATDYDIPTVSEQKNTYVFWFGNEPKLAVKTVKSRNYAQKYNGKTIEGEIKDLTYSQTTKVMDGFIIKATTGELLKANVEAKFAEVTKAMISKGDKIYVKIYNANYKSTSTYPVLTSYKLMKDGKLLFDRWPKVAVNQLTPIVKSAVVRTGVKTKYADSLPKPKLLSSRKLTVDAKADVHYIKAGRMQVGKDIIEAEYMIWDRKNDILTAETATIKYSNREVISGNNLEYNFKSGTSKMVKTFKYVPKDDLPSKAYQLISKLKFNTDSIKKYDVLGNMLLKGSVNLNIDNYSLSSKIVKVDRGSNIITSYLGSIKSPDGVITKADVIEFDVITNKFTTDKTLR